MTTQAIEDIYPLSPMQRGMLFQSLYQEESGAYWQQMCASLSGALDVDGLARAWATVIDRHAILRTAFEWEDLDEPLQLVCRQVALPFETLDWRELPAEEQERRLDDLSAAERRRGADAFQAPPLMRLVLVRTTEEAYRLVWTFHHILLDGWCSGAVLREVFSLYDTYRTGNTPTLEPPVPYRNYIAWLGDREGARSDEAYWRRVLAGFGAPTPLPKDAPSGVGHAAETLRLAPYAAAAVAALARRGQVTQNTLVQTAWAILLGLYSGEDDVVFGAVVSGRPAGLPGVLGIIGLFINTVPVRIRIRYDAALVDLVREIQRQQQETREREYNLLADVRSWSDLPAGQALFESLLVFQNFPVDQGLAETLVRTRDVAITGLRSTGQATFPLTLSASANDGLALRLEYDRSRFQAVGIRRILDHLAAWLAGFADQPERRVADVPWLTSVERQQVLEWNDTARFRGADLCLDELVEAQAARSPEATALVWQGGEMSYRELVGRATSLARRLGRRSVGPDTVVGVLLERSPEMVVALLGVLKAGGAYLPLDPGAPRDRQDLIVADARPALLITVAEIELSGQLSGKCGELPRIHLRPDDVNPGEIGGPMPEWGSDRLAYVIYTSGSTGEPKGVMISHRGIVNRLLWTLARFPLGAGDCLLQKTPFVFDASIWEIFAPLIAGAKLALAESGGHRDTAYLLRAVEEHRATVLQLVPSMLGAFLQEEGVEEKASGLRHMFCGGEVLPPALAGRFFERLSGVGLCNLYGPTEVSIDAASWRCSPGELHIPIGRPLENVRTWVLGPGGRPVPQGASGILHVGGVGLARGYLGRPGPTAERFVPDPFSGVPGSRLYDTGDLVRQLPDGALEYLGRTDHQVKVRGFRVELGEIESCLVRHPAVHGAVVVALPAPAGGPRLVAYVAHGRNDAPTPAELKGFLARSLPEHMVPSGFVLLESFPRTTGGKVDRRALPLPEAASVEPTAVAPRSPVEEILAEIWQEVLSISRPGAHDHFFDLGGHSLLATQVISRVRKVFGLEVPLKALFEAPTLDGFATVVEQRLAGDDLSEAPPIERVSRATPLPLSFAQQRLWFLHQLEPESPAYNIPLSLRLLGSLDVATLEASLGELVRRHEGLRTTFPATDGQPEQRIAPPAPVRLPFVHLHALAATARDEEVRRLTRSAADAPFALQAGPLLRLALLRSGAEDHILLLSLHHAIADGWSLAILVRDVAVLYEAFLAGRASPLTELPIQYADYAHWQRRWLAGAVLELQLAYWREALSGASQVFDLPADRSRPAMLGSRGAALPVAFGQDLVRRLKSLGREQGVTLFMTLLGAFQVLLGRTSGQSDVCIGTPVAGRNRLETESLVGLLLNALVLRGDLSGEPGFRDLLGRVRTTTLGAYAHQDVPFELVVEDLRPERSLSHAPLYQVMLILQNTPRVSSELPGLTIEAIPREHTKSNLDLTLNLAEVEGELLGSLEYSTDLFNAVTIERLLRRFEVLLRGVVAEADLAVTELPWLAPGEREQLLATWNRTDRAFPIDRPFHDLFRDQAQRTPRSVAAVCGGVAWTYAELDERSSRLAGRLLPVAGRPEAVVALLAERSLAFLGCMLAIWKAGCVYLPIDPLHPPQRLASILHRSGAAVLLADQSSRAAAVAALDELPVSHRPDLLAIEELLARPADLPRFEPAATNGLPPLAYILFTSGSTGIPKGAMIEHRGMINHLFAKVVDLDLGPQDTIAQTASQTFDISIWQFLAASLVGGRVQILPDAVSHDPARLVDAVEGERVSILETVPSLLQALLLEIEARGQRRPAFAALRWLIPTGEALAPDLCRSWLASYTRVPLLNAYGPTECSDDVTHQTIDKAPGAAVSRMPIGFPVPNTKIYVLDRFEPAPVGVAGELVVGGVGVGRGYLGDPAATARSFVPDPFSGEQGARLYRTGDLARRLSGGAVDFLGRIDHQVKVRGFRIELGEIETALNRLPQVRESAVLALGEAPGSRFLAAFVVPASGAGFAPAELSSALRALLPDYMVPSQFVTLAGLPLTTSGKLDRRALAALPRPELHVAWDRAPFAVPRTPTEELLAGIWGELLGLDRIGSSNNFFELGGHSLLATRVLSRLRQVLGVDPPLRLLFETATLADLGERIDELRQEGHGIVAPPIEPAPRDRPLPLSFAQQRLWFLDQLEPGSPFYNIPQAVRITGRLEAAHLARAVNEVTRRHEVLRTSFATVAGQPVQRIAPPEPFALPRVDLGALPLGPREREARRRVEQEARNPFDLGQGRPVRWTLLRLGAEEHIGLFTLHHVATDEWSMGILLGEIAALVEAFSAGRSSPLPELAIQYADYAAWQRGWLAGKVLEAQLAYWRERLAGELPVLALPTDHPRSEAASFRGGRALFPYPAELTRDLHALGRREGATLFMTLLAAFEVLLYRSTGQEDLILGTAIAGRDRVETEPLIGFFINMLPLRMRLAPTSSFRDLLRQVREVSLGAFAHQELPFDKLVEELQPDRQSSRAPIFQVAFGLRNVAVASHEISGLTFRPVSAGTEAVRFDLTLWMAEGPQGLAATWSWRSDLFEATTIERFNSRLETLLASVVARPEAELDALEMYSESEKERRAQEEAVGRAASYEKFKSFKPRAVKRPEEQA